MHSAFGLVYRRRRPVALSTAPTTAWGMDTSWVAPAIEASASVTSEAIKSSGKRSKKRKRRGGATAPAPDEAPVKSAPESDDPPMWLVAGGAILGTFVLLQALRPAAPGGKAEAPRA